MNNFIYCFNEKDKDNLLSKGFKLLQETIVDKKEAYIFLNNKSLIFDLKNDFVFSNQLAL